MVYRMLTILQISGFINIDVFARIATYFDAINLIYISDFPVCLSTLEESDFVTFAIIVEIFIIIQNKGKKRR